MLFPNAQGTEDEKQAAINIIQTFLVKSQKDDDHFNWAKPIKVVADIYGFTADDVMAMWDHLVSNGCVE